MRSESVKKIFKKNQLVITALAIMIAAAGYVSYSDSKLRKEEASVQTEQTDAQVNLDQVLEDIESLDEPTTNDITDETVEQAEDTQAVESSGEIPGEAVLTSSNATYLAQVRINREQIRAQNKETLLEIINNADLSEEERESAVASMVNMTDMIEKEAATELLLETKGFSDVVVNLTGETADIVVAQSQIDDASRAQIEDIVKRKTGIAAEKIVISPMKEG